MEELRVEDVQFIHPFLPLYNDKRLLARLAEVLQGECIKSKELAAAVQAARAERTIISWK